VVRLIGLQRIAANDLCKPIRAMRRRAPNRAHLIELHPVTEPSICQAASEPARPPPMTVISSCMQIVYAMKNFRDLLMKS